MSGEPVNIRQLAKLSGVSVGTVSRALNGYADVRPETRERIIALARELDYTPAAAARALSTQRSHVLGIFLDTGEGHPDVQHPFFHEVLGGIKTAAGRAGYDLLLFASERPGNGYGPHSYLKRCRHHNVAGAVLMGVDPDDSEVRRLMRSDLPVVGVDCAMDGERTACVMSDNVEGARLAVHHAHALGHRRIATVTGLMDKRPGVDRLRGYRDALRELKLAFRDEYVAYGDFYADAGHACARELLALEEPPTAIFAASDMMALGVLRAASELGLRVPEDLSLIGFDDMQLVGLVQPPLTTVRQDKEGLGATAADALLRLIADDAATSAPITLPVELIVRGSTAKPPARS